MFVLGWLLLIASVVVLASTVVRFPSDGGVSTLGEELLVVSTLGIAGGVALIRRAYLQYGLELWSLPLFMGLLLLAASVMPLAAIAAVFVSTPRAQAEHALVVIPVVLLCSLALIIGIVLINRSGLRRRTLEIWRAVEAYMDRLSAQASERLTPAQRVGDEEAVVPVDLIAVVEDLLAIVDERLPRLKRTLTRPSERAHDYIAGALLAWGNSSTERVGEDPEREIVTGNLFHWTLMALYNMFGWRLSDGTHFEQGFADAGDERGWRRHPPGLVERARAGRR
jgi:hypothetical protein